MTSLPALPVALPVTEWATAAALLSALGQVGQTIRLDDLDDLAERIECGARRKHEWEYVKAALVDVPDDDDREEVGDAVAATHPEAWAAAGPQRAEVERAVTALRLLADEATPGGEAVTLSRDNPDDQDAWDAALASGLYIEVREVHIAGSPLILLHGPGHLVACLIPAP